MDGFFFLFVYTSAENLSVQSASTEQAPRQLTEVSTLAAVGRSKLLTLLISVFLSFVLK